MEQILDNLENITKPEVHMKGIARKKVKRKIANTRKCHNKKKKNLADASSCMILIWKKKWKPDIFSDGKSMQL